MMRVLDRSELTASDLGWEFEGAQHGGVKVCVLLIEAAHGTGPRAHAHPYEEVFVVLEGEATFTVGKETRVVCAGQIVVAPPDVPHTFVNSGQGVLRQVDIHPSARFVTGWLEP